MSLADALRGKQQRRISVPVLVSDQRADERAAAAARAALAALKASPASYPPEREEQLRESLEVAEAAARSHVVDVEFEAVPPAALEEMLAQHTLPDGSVDRDGLLPELAAACAVDVELMVVDLWREVLGERFSKGERDDLYSRLLFDLNYTVPAARLGKG